MAKKGNLVTGTAATMPARPSSPKKKALPSVSVEGADNGGVIVTVSRDNSGPTYVPPEKHVFGSYAEAEPTIAAQFGGKKK
jgi:hypothetical protein